MEAFATCKVLHEQNKAELLARNKNRSLRSGAELQLNPCAWSAGWDCGTERLTLPFWSQLKLPRPAAAVVTARPARSTGNTARSFIWSGWNLQSATVWHSCLSRLVRQSKGAVNQREWEREGGDGTSRTQSLQPTPGYYTHRQPHTTTLKALTRRQGRTLCSPLKDAPGTTWLSRSHQTLRRRITANKD